MKGDHWDLCMRGDKECKCTNCKKDNSLWPPCCTLTWGFDVCPISDCPDFEPDNEDNN